MSYYIYKYIEQKKIIYIGQTTNLKERVNAHKYDKLKNFHGDIFYTQVNSKQEMDLIEIILINQYKPIFNQKSLVNSVNIILNNELIWKNFNEKDFYERKDDEEKHKRYLKQKNYTFIDDNINKKGRKRVTIDKDNFIEINDLYERKILNLQQVLKKLNIGRSTFYKIRRDPYGFFGDNIQISRPKKIKGRN